MPTLSRTALLVAALALGCGGSPAAPRPHAEAPAPPAPPRAAASPPAHPAASPAPPHACAPSAPRAVLVAARAGASIALAEAAGRRLAYVADEDHRAIHTFDADALRPLAVTPLEGRPAQVLPLPDGRILATLRDVNRVVVLEPGDRPEQPLTTRCVVPTYTEPFGLAVSADGARLAVTAGWDHRLLLLDAVTLATERVVDLPAEPRGVLLSADGESAWIAHMIGGRVSVVSLARPSEPPRSVFVRPERPAPEAPRKGEKPRKKPPQDKTQELAAAQGFALAEISLGATGGAPWPARVFAPMASSDPMRFDGVASFPGVYGGAGGPAVIGAFVAVLDPASRAPLGGEVAPLREARPEDCILPRSVAAHGDRLLVACLGIDAVVELDGRAADPITAERRRFAVAEGPTGVVVDAAAGRALVFSQHAGAITAIDLSERARPKTTVHRLARPEAPALSPQLARGRRLFHVSRDVRFSIDGRACASCHPDGRADGLTWATPDGPRQTILLAGRVAGSAPYGWFGDHPTMTNHVVFTVARLGGHGFETPQDRADLDALLAYLGSLGLPSRKGALAENGAEARRARGRDLYFAQETGCAACHVGDGADGHRHDVGSGAPNEKRLSFDTPALRGLAGSAPYFHDGRYATLLDLLGDPNSKMGHSAHLSDDDRRALAAFLETL